MTFTDRALYCRECGTEFVFSVADQEGYAARGLTFFPSRCPSCLAARRARNPNGGAENRPQGGSQSFGREQRQLFPAVCAECNQQTMVPFQPRTEKPVYCSDCFSRRQRAAGARG